MPNPNPSPKTRFGRGQPANPGGKPVGAKNAIGNAFLKALAKDFAMHGERALKELREERPDKYIEIVASLLPEEKTVNVSATGTVTHEHVGISATASWLEEMLGDRADQPPSKPLPH